MAQRKRRYTAFERYTFRGERFFFSIYSLFLHLKNQRKGKRNVKPTFVLHSRFIDARRLPFTGLHSTSCCVTTLLFSDDTEAPTFTRSNSKTSSVSTSCGWLGLREADAAQSIGAAVVAAVVPVDRTARSSNSSLIATRPPCSSQWWAASNGQCASPVPLLLAPSSMDLRFVGHSFLPVF